MRILFVASEAVPFAKTGGLGDVAGALPKALRALGHDVRLVLPRYRAVNPKRFGLRPMLKPTTLQVGGQGVAVEFRQAVLPGAEVPVYFIDAPALFDRDGLYQDADSQDYSDNLRRFSLFSQAALHVAQALEWAPDVLHAHDWQAGLAIAHRRLTRGDDPFWRSTATVFTIHNLAYQGLFSQTDWPLTNLPLHAFGLDGLEFYGQINCLKGGLVYADGLTTVSPTYAQEIQTHEFGCGLEGLLARRQNALTGILNGIDVEEWNPKTDPSIATQFGPEELAGKALCKLALQERQKLPARHGLLLGMIQRLVEQKGIDLFVQAAEELFELDVQVVILGTGEPAYHRQLTALAKRFPDKLSVVLAFDAALAHQIEAGADAFLMPSRFEPCGLNQFYSMRYGAVPIVRRVGGLADSVTDVTPQTLESGTATGFTFEPYTADAMLEAVQRAVAAFGNHGLWYSIVRAGMRGDWSWARAAGEYASVYEHARAGSGVAAHAA
jgi:starch synthase